MIGIKNLYDNLNSARVITCRGTGDVLNITKELINTQYSVYDGYEFLVNDERRLKLDYVKREIEWYVRGNRWDDSIVAQAKIWSGCIARDGGINSNYGQYLFGPKEQLVRVIRELHRDMNSRRAVAMILGQHVLHWDGIDQPCTSSIQFLIRAEQLHLIVTMRSQDAIFGLNNDVPAFMFIGKVVASALNLALGGVHMNIGSLHVYERHFDMVKRICAHAESWTIVDKLPAISGTEAIDILHRNTIPEGSALWAWVKNESL